MRDAAAHSAFLLALTAIGRCQPWPVAQCNEWVDVYASRLVDCGYYATHAEADADLRAGLEAGGIDGCEDVERIVLPDLWEEQCIPQTRASPCEDVGELPNACLGQLVARR